MTHDPVREDERANRILAGKLQLLFRGHAAIPGNFVVACVVAALLWRAYPHAVLVLWLTATALIGVVRLLIHRYFLTAVHESDCTTCWAVRFTVGAFASGALWGLACAGLAFWGTPHEFILMTFVAAGMTAGALATFSAYLPAYLAYAGAFTIPLASASLVNSDIYISGNGLLVLLYFVVVSLTAKYNGRFLNRTVELQVDNEILQASLKQTRLERDHARVEKWSTMAQLSHELRTPLNAILGFSEAMQQEFFGALSKHYKEYAGHIHVSGRHLLRLTEELLELSRGESGELKLAETTFDVPGLIGDLVQVLNADVQTSELSLTTEIAPDLPLLLADPTKVRQMLLNLTDNAVKFTPPGGRVSIKALRTAQGGIQLCVQDNGIGMSADDIPVALRPFGRLATSLHHTVEGAGLGLPICKRLAKLHGAMLRIDSAPHQGTTCTIQFPAFRSVQTSDKGAAAAA